MSSVPRHVGIRCVVLENSTLLIRYVLHDYDVRWVGRGGAQAGTIEGLDPDVIHEIFPV